jgi:hypothetical protein
MTSSFLAFNDTTCVSANCAISSWKTSPVTHESASGGVLTPFVHSWNSDSRDKSHDLVAATVKERVADDHLTTVWTISTLKMAAPTLTSRARTLRPKAHRLPKRVVAMARFIEEIALLKRSAATLFRRAAAPLSGAEAGEVGALLNLPVK